MVPIKDLDDISFPITEGKQAAGKQVQTQFFFYHYGQTIDRLAHIGDTEGNKDLDMLLMIQQHQSDSSVMISRFSVLLQKDGGISMRNRLLCKPRVRTSADNSFRLSTWTGTGTKETVFVFSCANFIFQ